MLWQRFIIGVRNIQTGYQKNLSKLNNTNKGSLHRSRERERGVPAVRLENVLQDP